MYQHINNLKFSINRNRSIKTQQNQSHLNEFECARVFTKIHKTPFNSVKHKDEHKESQNQIEKAKLMLISSMKLIDLHIQTPVKTTKLKRYAMASSTNSQAIACLKSIAKSRKNGSVCIQNARPSLNQSSSSKLNPQLSSNAGSKKIVPSYTNNLKPIFLNKLIAKRKLQNPFKTLQKNPFSQKKCITDLSEQIKNVKSQSYLVMQYPSKKVILAHRARVKFEIASLTKIMTFFVILKILKDKDLDQTGIKVTVSAQSTKIVGTKADLQQGEEYTISDLLYAMMLPSGNDAASELACWGGGIISAHTKRKAKIGAFVNQMNKICGNLGMFSTTFANPHGLAHPQAKSTALDMAALCSACMENQLFRKVVNCKRYVAKAIIQKQERYVQWQNTNKLLGIDGFSGLKTGTTSTAGPCLASTYNFRENIYITIVLKAPQPLSRFKETCQLVSHSLFRICRNLSETERVTLQNLKYMGESLANDSSEEQESQYKSANHRQLTQTGVSVVRSQILAKAH